jgi:hypothetical protein
MLETPESGYFRQGDQPTITLNYDICNYLFDRQVQGRQLYPRIDSD